MPECEDVGGSLSGLQDVARIRVGFPQHVPLNCCRFYIRFTFKAETS
jgi:hypothetical protein